MSTESGPQLNHIEFLHEDDGQEVAMKLVPVRISPTRATLGIFRDSGTNKLYLVALSKEKKMPKFIIDELKVSNDEAAHDS